MTLLETPTTRRRTTATQHPRTRSSAAAREETACCRSSIGHEEWPRRSCCKDTCSTPSQGPELHDSGPYVISQFIGGIAPAIFLFLTGVTLAFLMHGLERKAATARRADTCRAQTGGLSRRCLAIAFRTQLWLFAYPQSPWTDLLRVDILNCMALAILTMALVAAQTTAQRVHAGVVVGLVIACASPLISLIPRKHDAGSHRDVSDARCELFLILPLGRVCSVRNQRRQHSAAGHQRCTCTASCSGRRFSASV